MTKKLTERIPELVSQTAASAKSIVKMVLQSRHPTVTRKNRGSERLIVMGNGPSLAQNIANDLNTLQTNATMAVNFAANAPEFETIAPDYYLLCDPHFFQRPTTDPNVTRLFERMENSVTWPMTLYIPMGVTSPVQNPNITVEHFNPVGVEGFDWLTRAAYNAGLGMPRPRNVLIPAIMTGILAGYKEIVILGADHSWTRTLSVSEENVVQSIQPHFYKDNSEEEERVTAVYRNVKLHEILLSFHLAFRSYHAIENYARKRSVNIVNATPSSFIDAFKRGSL
ncbi:MAG: hypothetical protein NC339_03930 [Muribaculaceae bacterium]|nr:hypothetical protein [Muribaculaceae bacterium]